MSSWALTVGHWRRVPIRLHASLPIGLFVLSGLRFAPLEWLCLTGLVLLHELGHAVVVRRVGARATEVMLTGFGGHCAWEGEVTPLGRAAIASGGVAAQLVVLLLALATWALDLWPQGEVASTVLYAATMRNGYLIALNLLPLPPLDGAEAWAFPYRLGQRARVRLTVMKNVRHAGGDVVSAGSGSAEDQAKRLAAQLLSDARKEEQK